MRQRRVLFGPDFKMRIAELTRSYLHSVTLSTFQICEVQVVFVRALLREALTKTTASYSSSFASLAGFDRQTCKTEMHPRCSKGTNTKSRELPYWKSPAYVLINDLSRRAGFCLSG